MTGFASRLLLLAGGALALVPAPAAPAAEQSNYAPDLQSGPGGWTHPFGGDFPAVRGSAIPVRQDPRYEGDTLVVDTIGLNTRTVVDSFRTPHTEKLHVVERWHLIDGGNMLEVNIAVDDPDTFYRPWQTYQRYQRGQRSLSEDICAENNTNLFDYHMPVADKPDF
jgi:hypothetical protein